jgi:hypothetical protein
MASSSSDASNSSTKPETSREMTPEFDSKAAYEACAPLHWDAEEWDFWAWSEDDESLTDGEDLQFFLDGELEDEDDDDDNVSWERHDSSSEEEDDDESTEEDPTAGSFPRARSSDEDDDRDNGGDSDDGASGDDGSTSDDGVGDGGNSDDDGDVGAVPPIKHHIFLGTYWW